MRQGCLTLACPLQDCLEMESIGSSTTGLPEGSHAIEGPRVQRQVVHTTSACPAAIRRIKDAVDITLH